MVTKRIGFNLRVAHFFVFCAFQSQSWASAAPTRSSDTSGDVAITAARVLTNSNFICPGAYFVVMKTSDLSTLSPEMLRIFSENSTPVGFIHPENNWYRVNYFARKRTSCHLIISVLQTRTNTNIFLEQFQRLIKIHDDRNGVIMRNTDYFVFLTQRMKEAEEVLLSEVREKLRYKIAIYQSNNLQTVIMTVNPYTTKDHPTNQKYKWGKLLILDTFNSSEKFNQSTSTQQLFLDFTWNFQGYPMKMAVFTTQRPTYETMPDKNRPGYVLPKRGFLINLTETVHTRLNMSCSLFLCTGTSKLPAGTVMGILLPNSTWIGCMGDVVNGRAHISIAAAVLNHLPYVDFLPKHKYDFIRFVSRKPLKSVPWTIIYKEYPPLVWFCILASSLLTAVFIKLGIKIRGHHPGSLASILCGELKILVGQCISYPLLNNAGDTSRALFLLWLLCSLILGAGYNSKLTSLMSNSETEENFPFNFKLLAMSESFKVGAATGFHFSSGGAILKTTTSPVMKIIYERIEQDENIESCMRRALTSDYACLSWSFQHVFQAGVEFADSTGESPFYESKDMFSFVPLAQIVRKREVFQDSYTYFLENAYEMGLNDKWASMDMFNLRSERLKSGGGIRSYLQSEKLKPLAWSNVFGCFVIVGIGMIIAVITFILETKLAI